MVDLSSNIEVEHSFCTGERNLYDVLWWNFHESQMPSSYDQKRSNFCSCTTYNAGAILFSTVLIQNMPFLAAHPLSIYQGAFHTIIFLCFTFALILLILPTIPISFFLHVLHSLVFQSSYRSPLKKHCFLTAISSNVFQMTDISKDVCVLPMEGNLITSIPHLMHLL